MLQVVGLHRAASFSFLASHDYCCSVAQSCPTLNGPMDCSMPGFPVFHCVLEFAQTMSIELVMPSIHLILPPSIFPSIRAFSNESVFHIRWSKYWSFTFSISPSNEYSGLISFGIDWLDLLAVQGKISQEKTLQSPLDCKKIKPVNPKGNQP